VGFLPGEEGIGSSDKTPKWHHPESVGSDTLPRGEEAGMKNSAALPFELLSGDEPVQVGRHRWARRGDIEIRIGPHLFQFGVSAKQLLGFVSAHPGGYAYGQVHQNLMDRPDQPRGLETASLRPLPAGPACGDVPSVPEHRLFGLIASGAYGEVWLGCNTVGTPRAVKTVRREQHTSAESFEREFKGLQRFEPVSRTHDGLVDILTLGLLPGGAGFYYVMELADAAPEASNQCSVISNQSPAPVPLNTDHWLLNTYQPRTLRAELKSRGALPTDEVIALGLKLAAALAHLHAHGLVHRDVKPSNILFIGGEPKLADAGLVAAVDDALSLVGTAGYIAPEGPGTPQADLYALGKVLYEAAFGKDRQEFPELPVDVASRPDHTRLLELNEIIAKACAHNPRQRYASAEAMRTELHLLESGKSVKTRHTRQQIWNVCKKAGLAIALVALVVTMTFRLMPRRVNEYVQSLDPEVNSLVEQGFVAWREGTPKRIRYAEERFQVALQKEPNFVPALYGLGAVYLGDLPKLREITEKLKVVAPDSTEFWHFLGFIKWHEGRFREGLDDMEKATLMHPACKEGLVWAYGGYGYFLQQTGDAEGAREQYRRAKKIAGIDPILLDHFGQTYCMRSNWDKALNYHQEAINCMPSHPVPYYWKARTLEEMGRFKEAIDADEEHDHRAEVDPAEIKRFYEGLRSALEQGGPEGYWRKRLAEELKKPSPDFYRIATFYAHLGDKDQAYDFLEKAFKRTPFAGGLMVDPCWDRNDEWFKALARKVGLMQ
jgi:serine/threonine protein kinase